ncbi:MAG: hypothetical protein SWE60_20315 [Thermodesulfobacteriota bacterium]|nr:hypothetical protein [Thermodesulfobacteriota bacterium]
MKWSSLIFLAVCILFSVYSLNNYRLKVSNQLVLEKARIADNLAISLSQVNQLLDEKHPIVKNINEVLYKNGYPNLMRKVFKDEVVEKGPKEAPKERKGSQ